MSQRVLLERAQAKTNGWLKSMYGGYRYLLEYCPHREETYYYELGAMYPYTKPMVRADEYGPAPQLVACDRYGRENKRGRSVKVHHLPDGPPRIKPTDELMPVPEEELPELPILNLFFTHYSTAYKRKDTVGMWMYNEGIIVTDEDKHAVEREYLKGWGLVDPENRWQRDRMELHVPTKGADKILSYRTGDWMAVLVGLGMVEQAEVDLITKPTTVARKYWSTQHDPDTHDVIGATIDYPVFTCTEMGGGKCAETDPDEDYIELVYSGFVNTYGGE